MFETPLHIALGHIHDALQLRVSRGPLSDFREDLRIFDDDILRLILRREETDIVSIRHDHQITGIRELDLFQAIRSRQEMRYTIFIDSVELRHSGRIDSKAHTPYIFTRESNLASTGQGHPAAQVSKSDHEQRLRIFVESGSDHRQDIAFRVRCRVSGRLFWSVLFGPLSRQLLGRVRRQPLLRRLRQDLFIVVLLFVQHAAEDSIALQH